MLKIATASEQVASHLKQELLQGRWSKTMPGRDRLAKELGVDASTIERAMQHLEDQGVVQSQGPGRRRRITLEARSSSSKRFLIIPYEIDDLHGEYLLSEMVHRMRASGHEPSYSAKSLVQLKHDPLKVKAMMEDHPHDACILIGGSHEVLEMASKSLTPCFSLFGRTREVQIAGTGNRKAEAIRDAVNSLCRHGHQRIVMLSKSETMSHGLSGPQVTFLKVLEKNGIRSGDYNLPQWDSTPAGLRKCLEALFKLTPPTAILIDEWKLHCAIQNFLIHKRDVIPHRVACICTDYHPSFKWCDPKISHIYWDPLKVLRLIMAWVDSVAKGKPELRKTSTPGKFVEGQDLAISAGS
ncbi:MAG: GntR family transcriptional regulator [Akkermansiaceae bacterium]|nr:GntR family transcriptional regulator [Akkermansiaceae bacterium]